MTEKISYLPFHAINEFMLTDYRKEVIKNVLANLSRLTEILQREINSLVRKYASIQGFRNSSQAPLMLKVNGSVQVFEKNPQFVAAILNGWQQLNKELAIDIAQFLIGRSWKILPIEADRSKLPGFMTKWPEAESFELLISEFNAGHTSHTASDNDITLMIVWLSNRLPYEMVSESLFSQDQKNTDELAE